MAEPDESRETGADSREAPGQQHERLAQAVELIQRSQVFVAQRLEITPEYLSRMKSASRPPSRLVALSFERVFGVNADWLLTGKGPMIGDLGLAERYMDVQVGKVVPGVEGIPVILRDRHGNVLNAMAERHVRARRSDTRERSVPLMDEFVEGMPRASSYYKGLRAHLPNTMGPGLYCVAAGSRWTSLFCPDEFILVVNRQPQEWKPQEVEGRLLVVRIGDEGALKLCRILLAPGATDRLQITVFGPSGSESKAVPREDVQVIGIVLMAFRLQFSPSAGEATREAEAEHAGGPRA